MGDISAHPWLRLEFQSSPVQAKHTNLVNALLSLINPAVNEINSTHVFARSIFFISHSLPTIIALYWLQQSFRNQFHFLWWMWLPASILRAGSLNVWVVNSRISISDLIGWMCARFRLKQTSYWSTLQWRCVLPKSTCTDPNLVSNGRCWSGIWIPCQVASEGTKGPSLKLNFSSALIPAFFLEIRSLFDQI